ncbi:lamin tail domain-containing protein [Flavobacteriaceae bacterium]|nr:lamin tail domain-containing protein [Flavobacteriaceae bacterium]
MKTLNTIKVLFLFLLISNISYGQIISQYIETNSGSVPKGIEIWNNTSEILDFSANNLVVQKGVNGGTLSTDFTLSAGTLAVGDVIVIGTSDMQATTEGNGATFYFKSFNFNGDDALAITYGGTTTDVFGTPGSDPGSSWTGNGVDTRNNNISLKSGITTGDTDGFTDPSTRFETTADGSTLTGFGVSPSGASEPEPGITLGAVSGNTNESGTTATFTAVLDVAPVSDVVLDVTSGDTGEVTVSPLSVTFTAANWDTPQTITASGVDDSDLDYDIDVTITIAVDDAGSDTAYAGISETTTVTNEDNELPPLIINEFLADPDAVSGDANGDGDADTGDDEFVEIYNNTLSDIDVSGYMINDAAALRHTFPSGSVIPAGEVIVVFGGGTPTNIPCLSQVASVGFLSLNNGGDTITILDASSAIVTSYSYGSEGEDNQSLGRDVDITGDFKKHSQITSNPVDFSPGRYNETNIPFSAVTWTGTTSSNWATATNWSTGAVPTSSDIVYVDGTFTNEPAITSTDAVALSVTIASGNTLTIDETSSLTVSGDFTNDGTVTLNSTADDFSSLIVTGTATGDITYNRYVNVYDDTLGGGWDLVGSPTVMTITDFITANGAAGSNVIKVLGDDYAFSQYDNALGQWDRYQTDSQTGSFTTGQGYSMATNAGDGATVAFTGTMQTTTQSIDIINNNGLNNVGRRWNLVSNPFPSFINGNTAAGTTNFLGANSTIMDGTFTGVYGWNGSSYTIYNLLDAAFSIAPGQAFWVAALNTTNTALNFTADMRTTTGTGDFVTGPQLLTYSVGLKLFNGETQKAATKLYFRDGLSLDLDPGYDAGAFNQSTKLSTRLPGGSQETAFARNAMGMDAMQNTRVPLEIRQNAGQAFTISIADMELPQDIYVYLEDTLNGTLTSLKDQDFELTAQSDLSGLDRFFIVFKSNSVLSNGDTLGIEALNVYKANSDSFVTIAGISPKLGKLNVSLYNILGQTVREKALNPTTATQTISTQGLASGLYIVQIKSGNQVFTKKIVIK